MSGFFDYREDRIPDLFDVHVPTELLRKHDKLSAEIHIAEARNDWAEVMVLRKKLTELDNEINQKRKGDK